MTIPAGSDLPGPDDDPGAAAAEVAPPQPRDIALEQATPEQAAALEEQSEPDGGPGGG